MTAKTLSTFKLQRAALCLAACLAAGVTLTAHAAAPAAPSVRVSYQDLNLATAQGSQALYARIEAAAREVCVVRGSFDLSAIATAKQCEAQAIAQAVRKVNRQELAAAYLAHLHHG